VDILPPFVIIANCRDAVAVEYSHRNVWLTRMTTQG